MDLSSQVWVIMYKAAKNILDHVICFVGIYISIVYIAKSGIVES